MKITSNLNLKIAVTCLMIATLISCRVGESTDLKVVGGTEDYSSYPAVVLLLIDKGGDTSSCTGTFISKRRILTAAHCVVDSNNQKADSIKVFKDTKSLVQGDPSEMITSTKNFVVFSGYNGNGSVNQEYKDVAILKFDKDLSVSTMSISTSKPTKGSKVDIVGYGKTDIVSASSNPELKRHKASSTISNIHESSGLIEVSTTQVGMTTAAPAQGDSGGPLISGGKVIGIVSWGAHFSLDPRNRVNVGNKVMDQNRPLMTAYVGIFKDSVNKFIQDNLTN